MSTYLYMPKVVKVILEFSDYKFRHARGDRYAGGLYNHDETKIIIKNKTNCY